MTNAVLYQVLDVLFVLAAVNFITSFYKAISEDEKRGTMEFATGLSFILAIALGLILLFTNMYIWFS